MTTYKYELCGIRLGGEHTIGTIPVDVASYWIKQGQDVFEQYMWSWGHDEMNEDGSIPEKYQLPEWWEVDDIEHLNAVEFEIGNCIVVEDAETRDTVLEVEMTEDRIGSIYDPIKEGVDATDKAIVYGQSFEKGGWNFETLETKEPFDLQKLKFELTVWNDLKLVHALTYEDHTLNVADGDTIGKSYACWIDHWELLERHL